ncbi:hypothetical protein NM208_g13175 [Fusarium decemcellulare]|uniref:Uncharacterized protein n=1 Tax=Fusarium decemcellulare TaxID=57161 RepID=A0ACC1RKT0_9HYPO|nr:hypothetical protein NM208_g13175 [Fusarium decemcellulare]
MSSDSRCADSGKVMAVMGDPEGCCQAVERAAGASKLIQAKAITDCPADLVGDRPRLRTLQREMRNLAFLLTAPTRLLSLTNPSYRRQFASDKLEVKLGELFIEMPDGSRPISAAHDWGYRDAYRQTRDTADDGMTGGEIQGDDPHTVSWLELRNGTVRGITRVVSSTKAISLAETARERLQIPDTQVQPHAQACHAHHSNKRCELAQAVLAASICSLVLPWLRVTSGIGAPRVEVADESFQKGQSG